MPHAEPGPTVLSSAVLALALLALGGAPPAPADDGRTFRFEEFGLVLTLPELERLTPFDEQTDEQARGLWAGFLDGTRVDIQFRVLPREEFRLEAPEDVADLIEHNRGLQGGQDEPTGTRILRGAYGWAPFAFLVTTETAVQGGTARGVGSLYLAGLTETHGYVVEVACTPPAGEEQAAKLIEFLDEGVRYTGEPWDPRWTDEEASQRWLRDAPEGLEDRFDLRRNVNRTDHYIIFTNSGGGRIFARNMEDYYRRIKEVFPFEEVEGNRLMPVFLFRTQEQYYQFSSARTGMTMEEARRTKGHASADYYATWYEAPNDPVHIHEATHQIFHNRLRLRGGGSWFQEGVAVYIETSKNDRNVAARLVRRTQHVPLADFIRIPSLALTQGTDTHGLYMQAGLLIEFLREGPFAPDRFQDFVHTMGAVPRGNESAIRSAIKQVYEVDLQELEQEWIRWCARR